MTFNVSVVVICARNEAGKVRKQSKAPNCDTVMSKGVGKKAENCHMMSVPMNVLCEW